VAKVNVDRRRAHNLFPDHKQVVVFVQSVLDAMEISKKYAGVRVPTSHDSCDRASSLIEKDDSMMDYRTDSFEFDF
jgi:hypothetical protein